MTPTRLGTNGATQTSGWLPNPASRAPASTVAASTRCGATLTLATRSPRVDHLPVERGEDLERVDPVEALEVGDPDVERRPAASASRSTRLCDRAALGQVRAGHRGRQPERGLVLVELAGLGDEDADRIARLGRRRGPPGRRRSSRRPFDQRVAADHEVARQDRAGQPGRRAPARGDAMDLHAVWLAGRSVADLAPQRGLDRAAGVDDGHARPGTRGRRGCRC